MNILKYIMKGALDVLAQLGTNMNAIDNVGNTALHKAVTVCTSSSVKAVVSCLVSKGAKPSIRNREGDTPLHLECRRLRTASLDVMDALLYAGADPNRYIYIQYSHY
jgi:ankyrin repeat protein